MLPLLTSSLDFPPPRHIIPGIIFDQPQLASGTAAAAAACLSRLRASVHVSPPQKTLSSDQLGLRAGDVAVLVDCGGGTVDIVTHVNEARTITARSTAPRLWQQHG